MLPHDSPPDEFEERLRLALGRHVQPRTQERLGRIVRDFRVKLHDHPVVAAQSRPFDPAPARGLLFLRWALGTALVVLFVAMAATALLPRNPLDRTIRAVRSATSMVCEVEARVEGSPAPPSRVTLRWTAPDKLRMDTGGTGEPARQTAWIEPGRASVVNYGARSAHVTENLPHKTQPLPAWAAQTATVEGLTESFQKPWKEIGGPANGAVHADYAAGWAESLGKRWTQRRPSGEGGSATLRFESKGADSATLPTVLLVDPRTFLPAEIRMTYPVHEGGRATGHLTVTERFSWNVPVAADLMTPRIPEEVSLRVLDGAKQAPPEPIQPGVGVGAVRLGMSLADVRLVWGEPDEAVGDTYYNYFGRGAQLTIVQSGGVRRIACLRDGHTARHFKAFTGTTAGGVGLGATEEEVVAALGEPAERTEGRLPGAPAAPAAAALPASGGGASAMQLVYPSGLIVVLEAAPAQAPAAGEAPRQRRVARLDVVPTRPAETGGH